MYKFVSYIILCLALVGCRGGYEAGMKAYNLGEYEKAAELFNSAQAKETNKGRRANECFLMGECYRSLGMTQKAASAYSRAVRYKCDDDEAYIRLAEVYRSLGKFDEADEALGEYKERHRTDRRIIAAEESSKLGRESWAELTKKHDETADSGYIIKPFREINSKFSDYSPIYVGDGYDVVYFSSMRQAKKKRKGSKITGQGYSTIYMSRIDGKGKWTEPQPLDEPFGEAHVDDGAAFVSSDGHTMLFTRCLLADQKGSPVHAYEMSREGGRWSDPVRISPGGDSTMMVAHPALSPDGQTLYFVSDYEQGSIGGLDLWTAQRNVDGSWGPATNMGALINTAGDEVFPYVRQDGTLYFSSNGHKGYGGLDVYRAMIREDGLYDVMNMGIPINSAADDFGISFMGLAEEGMIASNRDNSRGYDNIYTFYLPPVILTIEGTVGKSGRKAFEVSSQTNTQTSTTNSRATASKAKAAQAKAEPKVEPIENSFVRIVGTDGTNMKMKPDSKGRISFVAERDVRYIILAGAPGYTNERAELSTEGLNKTQTLKFTALLNKLD